MINLVKNQNIRLNKKMLNINKKRYYVLILYDYKKLNIRSCESK